MAVVTDAGQKKSFADILNSTLRLHEGSNSSDAMQMEGLRKGLHRGKPAAFFSSPKLSSYAVPFKWALIGKFSQGRPRMEDIHKFFVSLDLKGSFKLGLLDSRHIVMIFDLEGDFHRIFSRMSWNVFRWPMRVFKYTVDFHVNKESSIVPVWINFEKLPLVLFNKEALFTIASLIGTPLRLDTATAEVKRPSVARVQVEIDLLKPAPEAIWIGMGEEDEFWQKVKFENLPAYCAYCWHLGHIETHCIMKHPELKEESKAKPMTQTKAPQVEKIYRPKVMQVSVCKEDAATTSRAASETEKIQEQDNFEKVEDWTVVQSRKAKKHAKNAASKVLLLNDPGPHLLEDPKSLTDLKTLQKKTQHSLPLVVDVPESSSVRNSTSENNGEIEANVEQHTQEDVISPRSNSSKAIVVYSHGSSNPDLRTQEVPNIENLKDEEIDKLVEEGILAATQKIIHEQAERVLGEDTDDSDSSSQHGEVEMLIATGNLSPRKTEFHPNHWKVRLPSSKFHAKRGAQL